MNDKLAVMICATEDYQYAMSAQARAVHANLRHLAIPIVIVLVGDDGLKEIERLYVKLFKAEAPGSIVKVIANRSFKQKDGGTNYKQPAQILIASMRTAAVTIAREEGATLAWSLDSDVLPKTSNCFRTLRWLLDIPGNFYEVAISPYPSQGGGDFLTGRGAPENPIFEDYIEKERRIPEALAKELEAHRTLCAGFAGRQPPIEILRAGEELRKKVQECPPLGNVFDMNAKNGWRRRGWLSAAYPALGRGVIVPSDWCGFGNTLMSARALDECDWVGYDGGGTEDLYAVFWRWHQVGIKIGSALHEPSIHISRRKDGKYFAASVRFVTEGDEQKGECVGHLRIVHRPYYGFDQGEKYDPANDGFPSTPQEREEAAKRAAEEAAKAAAAAAEQAKAEEIKKAIEAAAVKPASPERDIALAIAEPPPPMPAEPAPAVPPS